MLDVKFVRENIEAVKAALLKRNQDIPLGPFLEKEERRRGLMKEVEDLRNRRNVVSEEIGRIKKRASEHANLIKKQLDGETRAHVGPYDPGQLDAAALMEEMRGVGDRIKAIDEDLRVLDEETREFLLNIPNIPHESVPAGKDECHNVELRCVGKPRDFGFEPLNHWDIGEKLGIIDFERAAKIAGARFALMTGAGARLERAIMNLMLDTHTARGYREVLPPILVNRASMTGTGQLPKFEQDLFRVADPELYLIPTAEVPVTNIHAQEILEEEALTIRYTAFTPCFRREAGAAGKDTRGLIRQHQFNKVELVKFARPEDSYAELETLTADAEDILVRLGLPYRVVALCSGDLGFSSAKTYDIEVWLPGQAKYREISSCSNFEDFQARRAGIRFRRAGKKGTEFVHTLNGSGLAIGRTLVAVLENYQQEDGSVVVPDALRQYMGTDRIGA